MFDVDQFCADCRGALEEDQPRLAVRELLDRALADPRAVADVMRPVEGGLNVLYNAPDLTVMHLVWAPGMRLYPHDHRMWAAIGIYGGREDNAFYRRSGPGNRFLDETGGRRLDTGDVLLLGDDTIHAVSNPLDHLTGAIHVYGGDFINQPRSQWGPGPEEERPFDYEGAQQHFAEANAAWRAREDAATA
jgi:predicted metal-dependent enzyme (double-stranded beta helix superfamily)